MPPDPLHPAIVHLPMVLAVIIPVVAFLGIRRIHREILSVRSWVLFVVLQVLLVGSGRFALETGESS